MSHTECEGCGKRVETSTIRRGRCQRCTATYATYNQKQSFDHGSTSDEKIASVLLTTETAPNLQIIQRIEIVTAEVAYGMHIFKDLFADIRDIVGGRSKAVQNTMRDARRTALYELKREAYEVGANAVVGVDLDYVELSGMKSMVMLVASGTAVVIAPNNNTGDVHSPSL